MILVDHKTDVLENQKMKLLLFKFTSILLGLFFSFLILETTLQIASHFVGIQESFRASESSNKDQFTILALGESTTTGFFVSELNSAWPADLQNKLTAKFPGRIVKVYNRGITGANSRQVITEFYNSFRQLKPDLVIAMMGVNDQSYELTKKTKLRTLKLINSLYATFFYSHPKSEKICEKNPDYVDDLRAALNKLHRKDDLKSLNKTYEDFLTSHREKEFLIEYDMGRFEYTLLNSLPVDCETCIEKIEAIQNRSLFHFKNALKICPYNEDALKFFFFYPN